MSSRKEKLRNKSCKENKIKTEILDSSNTISNSVTGEENSKVICKANLSRIKDNSKNKSCDEDEFLIKPKIMDFSYKEFNTNSKSETAEENGNENSNSEDSISQPNIIKTEIMDCSYNDFDTSSNSENCEENENKDCISRAKNSIQSQSKNVPKMNVCNYCNEFFDNPILLMHHKRKSHNFPKTFLTFEEIQKYYDYPNRSCCPICKKVFKNSHYKSIFLKHLNTHTLLLVFECAICKRKFNRKDHMLDHQKRHVIPNEDISGKKIVES